MAKNIWIYSRKILLESAKNKILEICKNVSPDNIIASQPKVVVNGNVAYGIMNPTNTLLVKGNSLLMGEIYGDNSNWHIPQQNFPDGSYALFRDGNEYCEIVSDPVASRTIWYFMNDEIFIASTSQRAIIMFIGEFEFNEKVIPWMLSTGSLGPSYSWDKRINRVPSDSSVTLDKKNWSLSLKSNPIEFKESKDSDEGHEQKLRSAINSTFKSLKLNYSDWVLPLSGGYDSRAILCFLHSNNTHNTDKDLRTITWGLKSSLNEVDNDACVAQKVAKALNLPHKYHYTNLSEEPIEDLFNRFLLNGEGRIDHISGYMDGFKIWKSLYEDGVQGVIRGDECFGWLKNSSELDVRLLQGLLLCSDFSNLKPFTKKGLFEQEIPKHLKLREGESYGTWRDRLHQQWRLPTVMAALSDLKLPYVEVVNPLLSKRILLEVRKSPDHVRTEKNLFIKILNSISPKVAYAKKSALAKTTGILKQKQIVELLSRELSSSIAKELFPEDFLANVLEKINVSDSETTNKAKSFSQMALIKYFMPRHLKSLIRNGAPSFALPTIDNNVLAFRIYMVVRMNQILKDESIINLKGVGL